jgi:preprotein translocase subunit YajC
MIDFAYAMAPSPGGGGNGGGGIFSVLPLMIGMFAIMYFLIIRPQQKQRRERETLLQAIKKGDRVVTTSGLFGTVVGLSDQTVTLKVADQVKLDFERSAIGRIVTSAKESNG